MAELLVFASNNTHADPVIDARDTWKRGMVVTIKEDGHTWGAEEKAPLFLVVKLPGVPVELVAKYVAPQMDPAVPVKRYRRRLWQLQVAEMPAGARSKIAAAGVITIAPSGGDFTWAQVKGFFARLDTNARETADVTGG